MNKIIGIGGCGINLVSEMTHDSKFRYAIIDVDPLKIARWRTEIPESVCLFPPKEWVKAQTVTPPIHHIDGYIEQALINESYKIEAVLANVDEIYILTGLGGHTGTILPHKVATIAGEMGIMVKATVTLPNFKESEERRKRAEESLKALRKICGCKTIESNI